jgi:type II secretory pathway pseudopilin PulG
MTVMAVLSILTGIAYLRLGPAFTRANVRSAANLIATDLQQAQMLAVRHRRPIVFEADVGAPRYDIRNRAGDTIYVDVPLGPGTEYPLDEFTAVPATLEFFPNGLSSADAAFTVGIGGYRRQVSLTRAGQIRISSAP